MPSLRVEYIRTVARHWGKEISGPITAGLSIGLIVLAPFFKTMSTTAILVKLGAGVMAFAAFFLMLVAGYEAWKDERRKGEAANNHKPDLAGKIISIRSESKDEGIYVSVLFVIRNLSPTETMLQTVILKLVDIAGNSRSAMLPESDGLMQARLTRGDIHRGSFEVRVDGTMQDINQSESSIHITDAFEGDTVLSLGGGLRRGAGGDGGARRLELVD